MQKEPSKTYILGTLLSSDTKEDIYERIKSTLENSFGTTVYTPNSSIIYDASKSPENTYILNTADISIPDGSGVFFASKLFGLGIESRMSGIDTASFILKEAEERYLSVFLLGGKEGVADRAAKNLKNIYPKLKISGTHHGYFDKASSENTRVIEKINNASPDILFVCFGYPLQERWIYENKNHLKKIKLFIGLGGTLDVFAGDKKRAPEFLRFLGLEWLWRAVIEPRRIKDLYKLPAFIIKLSMEKIKSKG